MNSLSQAQQGPLRELSRERGGWRWRAVYHRDYHSPAFTALLTDPDASLLRATTIYKDDAIATVWGIGLDGRRLVIKRHNPRGPWFALRHWGKPSRAARAWQNGWELLGCELPTPTPAAFIEETRWGLPGRCYLLTEAVPGPHARAFFAADADAGETTSAARRIARLLRGLWAAGFVHNDLKDTNVILTPEGPHLIDLDALREYPPGRWRRYRRRRDRNRFLRNWRRQPTLRRLFAELLPE